jgi:hypothetical protein
MTALLSCQVLGTSIGEYTIGKEIGEPAGRRRGWQVSLFGGPTKLKR